MCAVGALGAATVTRFRLSFEGPAPGLILHHHILYVYLLDVRFLVTPALLSETRGSPPLAPHHLVCVWRSLPRLS